jgi:N,N-dimethylformamidase
LILGDGSGDVAEFNADFTLRERQWVRLSAAYDFTSGRARIMAEPHADSAAERLVSPTRSFEAKRPGIRLPNEPRPFVFAAWRDGADERGEKYTAHFDGKLEAPRVLKGDLSADALAAHPDSSQPEHLRDRVVGWWDFSHEIEGRRIIDRSENRLHGQLENLPTRGVTGLRWDGSEHDWRHAPEQYAAIHFHSDDVYDAGWYDAFTLEVPRDWKSGIYAARLRSDEAIDHIPFFVAPPRGAARAKLAFLVPTATYLAYANMPDPHAIIRELERTSEEGLDFSQRLQSVMAGGEFGLSCYHTHADGSGVHHSSHLRPVRNLKPRPDLWAFNADTLISDWLEASGLDYDVITDELLHAEGVELLAPYRTVITGTHPEYTSTPMRDALDRYLGAGGRLIYTGANGFYWRIAYSDAWPGAIELRRAEDGTRAWESQPGEYHHAWNGELGGLWRRIGRAPNQLVGIGFAAQGFGEARGYQQSPAATDPRAAFVFDGVQGERFGDFGRLGGAAGEEIDRCEPLLGSPPHALVLASAVDFAPDMMKTKEEFLATAPPDSADPHVRADLVFFETPKGGAVFSTGSIAWAGSLAHNSYDNDVSRITRNVVRRFLDPEPFEAPS